MSGGRSERVEETVRQAEDSLRKHIDTHKLLEELTPQERRQVISRIRIDQLKLGSGLPDFQVDMGGFILDPRAQKDKTEGPGAQSYDVNQATRHFNQIVGKMLKGEDPSGDFDRLPDNEKFVIADNLRKYKEKHGGQPADLHVNVLLEPSRDYPNGVVHISWGLTEREKDRKELLAHPERERDRIDKLAREAMASDTTPESHQARLELRKEMAKLTSDPELSSKVIELLKHGSPPGTLINQADGTPAIKFGDGTLAQTVSLTKSVEQQAREAEEEFKRALVDIQNGNGPGKFNLANREAAGKRLQQTEDGTVPPHKQEWFELLRNKQA